MHIYAHVHVNICVQVHVNICVQVHVNIYAHVHVNICVQVYRRAIALAYENQFQIATNRPSLSAATLLECRCGGNPTGHYRRKAGELGEKEMKRMHEIEIGREWFQVETLTASQSANAIVAANDHRYNYADIYDAYQKPSEAKVSIWNEWVDWARNVNMFDDTYEVHDLRIDSASCFMFTVVAIIREFAVDETGNRIAVATYIMRVTKYHNYLYKLANVEDES